MLIKLYLGANIHYPDSIKMQLRVSQDQALPLLYKEKQQQQQRRTAHHSIQSSSHTLRLTRTHMPKASKPSIESPRGFNWEGQVKERGTHSGTESQGLKFRVSFRSTLWANPKLLHGCAFLPSLLCPVRAVWH